MLYPHGILRCCHRRVWMCHFLQPPCWWLLNVTGTPHVVMPFILLLSGSLQEVTPAPWAFLGLASSSRLSSWGLLVPLSLPSSLVAMWSVHMVKTSFLSMSHVHPVLYEPLSLACDNPTDSGGPAHGSFDGQTCWHLPLSLCPGGS